MKFGLPCLVNAILSMMAMNNMHAASFVVPSSLHRSLSSSYSRMNHKFSSSALEARRQKKLTWKQKKTKRGIKMASKPREPSSETSTTESAPPSPVVGTVAYSEKSGNLAGDVESEKRAA
mmetsp:Transcript_28535/g.32808  ORF Transcript_28535/g.32808 Transcript_28535/m.32808 type:complete len:120 (-) Transcript_28535:255-614(-)